MKKFTHAFYFTCIVMTLTACSTSTNDVSNLNSSDKQLIQDSEIAQYTYMQKDGNWHIYTGEDINYYALSKDVVAIESSAYCNATSCNPQIYKRAPKYGFCRVDGHFIRSADLMIEGNNNIKQDAVQEVLATPCI